MPLVSDAVAHPRPVTAIVQFLVPSPREEGTASQLRG